MAEVNPFSKDQQISISLVDVMYGVVFAYGFNFFDLALTSADFVRFLLSYALLVTDWFYFHSYWEKKHNVVLFLSDILLIFTFSRLLKTSVTDGQQFFLWLSVLYGLYLAWDLLIKRYKIKISYNISTSVIVNIIAGGIFFVMYLLLNREVIEADSLFWNLVSALVYLGTFVVILRQPRIKHAINKE